MFISDVIQFRTNSNTRDKEEYFIMLRVTPSRITNLNLMEANKRASKYTMQKLTELREEFFLKPTLIVGHFNTSPQMTAR